MAGRYLALFRVRAFRVYWLGFAGSCLGDEITKVALIWLVYDQTRSAEAVGWLMACLTGPIIVGGFLAGWLLDRFDRRAVLMVDNLVRAGVVGTIPILHGLGLLALWHLYLVAAIYGLLLMIPLAGTPALIPAMVPPDKVSGANAMEMLGYTVGSVLGPVMAGILISKIGAPFTIVIDVLSYLAFALCIWRMGALNEERTKPAATVASAGFASVFHLLSGNVILASTTVMFLTWNIGAGMLSVWLPILTREELGGGAELYGLLVGAQAAGQMASTLVIGALAVDGRLGLRICLAQAASGAVLAVLAIAGFLTPVVAVALAIFGACSAPLTIWAQTLRMRIVPSDMRGRAFALMRMLMQGGRPIGGALGGVAVPLLGVGGAIASSACLAGIPGLLGLLIAPLRAARVEPEAGQPAS